MPYLGEITQTKQNALSLDLQNEIIKANKRATRQVKNICKKFQSKTRKATAKKVWNYLRKNITYTKDRSAAQRIFLPTAFIHFKKGDCKSYATFAAAIFTALKIPNGFTFAAYKSRTTPSHIYNYIIQENGKRLPIDGCYSVFGKEKNTTFTKNTTLLK